MPNKSREHMKQATLKLHSTGQVSLKGRPPRATGASSPSHHRPLRPAHADSNSTQGGRRGATAGGRASSSDDDDDADPGLEAAAAREQDLEQEGGLSSGTGSGSDSEVDAQVGRASSRAREKGAQKAASSEDDDDDDEVPHRRSPSKTRRSTKAPSAPSLRRRPLTPSASDSDNDILPVSGKKRARPRSSSTSASEQAPIRQSSSKTKKRARAPSSSSATASEDDDLPIPESIVADNKRRASKREHQQQDAALRSSAKKDKAQGAKKRKLAALTQGRRDRRSADEESDVDFVVEDDVVQYDSSAQEEEQPAPVKKGKGKARARDEDEQEESDEAPARRSSSSQKEKGRRAKDKSREEVQRELLATDSDGSDADVGGSSRRRKKGSSKRKKRRRPSSDEDDEPDDLEILDEETVRENKFRARQDKSSRFAQLKAAREQRAAKNKAIVLDSDDEPPSTAKVASSQARHPHFLGETSSSGSSSDSGSDEDSDDEPARPRMATEDLSEDLDGFVVDESDGDDQVVHSWRESVRGQSQGLRYFVKNYLAYLVFLIVDPQCDWLASDKEWKDAHQRVHAHLSGLLNSLVSSSAWKPKFKHAVDTRPDMYLDALESEERGVACDACTMGKARHSTFRATVSGPKYDPKTLQPIDAEVDSSDESTEADGRGGRARAASSAQQAVRGQDVRVRPRRIVRSSRRGVPRPAPLGLQHASAPRRQARRRAPLAPRPRRRRSARHVDDAGPRRAQEAARARQGAARARGRPARRGARAPAGHGRLC
ncbi:uncharacterized protein RHOBADRAFT_49790, partial [Rhodotorula graminis WP1]